MTETPPQNPPTLQSSGRRHRHGATRRHPRAQYSTPPRIMCAGLTCIRAIAAAARTAGPRRRPPGTIPSPARPRSPAGARNAGTEVEGSDDSRRGARHRPAWVRCGLFWSEPRGRTYMTPGGGRTPSTEQRVRGDATSRAAKGQRKIGYFSWPVLPDFLRIFPISRLQRPAQHPPRVAVFAQGLKR